MTQFTNPQIARREVLLAMRDRKDLRNCQPCKQKMLAAMKAQATIQPGLIVRPKPASECPDHPAPLARCVKRLVMVSAEICSRCKADAKFRDTWLPAYVAHRAEREAPCRFLTELTCSVTSARVTQPDCWLCDRYSIGPMGPIGPISLEA